MQTYQQIRVLSPISLTDDFHYVNIEIGGHITVVWKIHQPKLFFAIEEAIGGRELEYPTVLNITVKGEIRQIKTKRYETN